MRSLPLIALSLPIAMWISRPINLAAQADSLGFTNKADAKNLILSGEKDGKWVEYQIRKIAPTAKSPDTTKDTASYRLAVYKSGKPYGIARSYTNQGILTEEDHYTDGKLNGIKKEYFSNGKLHCETPYNNGKIDGIKKIYYESGVLYREAPYAQGVPNGLEKYYYPTGKLKSILKYVPTKDGQFSILEKDYDENGSEIKE